MSSGGHYDWKPGEPPPRIGAHSMAKHEVLTKYIARYMQVQTRDPRHDGMKLTLVDGFAGGGRYLREDDGAAHPGSPLLMLRAIREAEAEISTRRRKPFALDTRFVFVEKSRSNIAYLRAVLAEEGHGARQDVDIVHGKFEEQVDAIVANIRARGRAGRSIFVLDQYGYKDVVLATIRDLFAKLPKAEVVLTFATDWLIDPLADTPLHAKALSGLGLTPKQLLEHKDEPAWRRAIELELHGHLQAQTGAKFYTPFFIVSPLAHRSYWLVHLSGHPKARDVMTQLHWEMHNYFAHYAGAGLNMFRDQVLGYNPKLDVGLTNQPFLFDAGARELAVKTLMEDIPRWLRPRASGVSFDSFFAENVNGTAASSDILKEAIVKLIEEREIEVLGPEGGRRRRQDQVGDTDVLRPILHQQLAMFPRRP